MQSYDFNISPAGDRALVLEFENQISPEVNAKVRSVDYLLKERTDVFKGILEVLPTYRSLLIYYDSDNWDHKRMAEQIAKVKDLVSEVEIPEPETLEVPVVYGGEFGPDLDFVAEHNQLEPEKVIEIHHAKSYLIYMLGFTPGFTYLGGMSEKIATPRLKNPRGHIPAGAVGIAGSQTGIYPIDSPGGWRIIGRTPLKLYDPYREDPILPKPGNHLKFYPISTEEYKKMKDS